MFCKKCGTNVADGQKFCSKCGTEVPMIVSKSKSNDSSSQVLNENKMKHKTKSKRYLPWVVLMVTIFFVAFIGTIWSRVYLNNTTIDLNSYIELEYAGYDNYGQASVDINWDDMKMVLADNLKTTAAGKGQNPYEILRQNIKVELDKTEGLSNNDEVSLQWQIDQVAITQQVKCKLVYEERKNVVLGLKEVSIFDPFADLTVEYEGEDEEGDLKLKYTGEHYSVNDYKCSNDSRLSNGDRIWIEFAPEQPDEMIMEFGEKPSETKKEYEVQGLTEEETRPIEIVVQREDTYNHDYEDEDYDYGELGEINEYYMNTRIESPFYGIWWGADSDLEDIRATARVYQSEGYSPIVVLTGEWSNLGREGDDFTYVASFGRWSTKSEADRVLANVQQICPDAYVKYSGDPIY